MENEGHLGGQERVPDFPHWHARNAHAKNERCVYRGMHKMAIYVKFSMVTYILFGIARKEIPMRSFWDHFY